MIDWLNDPMLKNMDPIKVELIKTAAAQDVRKIRSCTRPCFDDTYHKRK